MKGRPNLELTSLTAELLDRLQQLLRNYRIVFCVDEHDGDLYVVQVIAAAAPFVHFFNSFEPVHLPVGKKIYIWVKLDMAR